MAALIRVTDEADHPPWPLVLEVLIAGLHDEVPARRAG